MTLELKLPNLRAREQILRIHTRRLATRGLLARDIDLGQLAVGMYSFSGAASASASPAAHTTRTLALTRRLRPGCTVAGLVTSATSLALSRVVSSISDTDATLPTHSLQLTNTDFRTAVREVRRARGLTSAELRRHRGRLLVHSAAFEEAWQTALAVAAPFAIASRDSGNSEVDRVAEDGGDGQQGRIGSLLISGPVGGGRSSFAAQLASACNFSFVQMISADEIGTAPEHERLRLLGAIADDALVSDTAVIVLDDLERLLGHVTTLPSPDGKSAQASLATSAALMEGLLTLLRRKPPRRTSILLIGTTAHLDLISRTALLSAFDAHVALPALDRPAGVHAVLRLAGTSAAASASSGIDGAAAANGDMDTDAELDALLEAVPPGVTLKQLLRAVELARVVKAPTAHEDSSEEDVGAASTGEAPGSTASETPTEVLTAVEAASGATAAVPVEMARDTPSRSVMSEVLGADTSAAEEADSERAEGSPLVVSPLQYRQVDLRRFRELLQLNPWAQFMQSRGAGGEPVDIAHVQVVNSSRDAETFRWASGSASADEEDDY